MKSKYVSELANRDNLENEPFLLQDVARRTTKDGRPYALMTFTDRTGKVSGVYWDIPQHVDEWLRPGVAVLITGRVTSYKETLQINASDLNQWLQPDMSHFLPTSSRPVTEMVDELKTIISELAEPWQGFVSHILLAPDFLPQFSQAPAARTLHHAYLGGLLEHTLSMANIARKLAGHYPHLNQDLLISGILLHDMGKTIEYEVASAFNFSDDGRLIGHIVRAITLVEKAASELNTLTTDQLRQLTHLIASHHGNLEWGSPVVPKTLEAVLLHQIDMLDSRMQGFLDYWKTEAGNDLWSTKSVYMFNTELRRPT